MTTPTDECLDCVGGMAMEFIPESGTCFRICLTCQPLCPCCQGAARFPAWTRDMDAFIATYNTQGLLPVLCHNCGGLIDAVPLHPDPDCEDGDRPQ